MNVQIEASWKKALQHEFNAPYFTELTNTVRKAYLKGSVFPLPKFVFNAFELCPFDQVQVVILGQDPYHGVGQAHGLCFSVQDGVRVPPSLKNIYKEIRDDLGISSSLKPSKSSAGRGASEASDQAVGGYSEGANERSNEEMCRLRRFESGNLEHWARQGVLLLNATLTVEAGKAGSHQGLGWEQFTDAVIKKVSDEREHVVFLLWGKYAQEKEVLIDAEKHLVLKAPHPSPFSAHTGFLGCKHFSKTNGYLKEYGKREIVW